MCRQFNILLFILAIQQYRSVDCYAPGSLIWSRKLQEFIPITKVSTFDAYEQEILAKSREKEKHEQEILAKSREKEKHEQEIIAKSREKEKHNFQREVLNLGYFEDYNMIHSVDNDTKISGVCGEIWNTLAEYSNFTLAPIKVNGLVESENDYDFSALAMIDNSEIQIIPRISFSSQYSNTVDFTTPIWETRYRIYIQLKWKSDTNWVFNMFELKVWFAILLFFFLMSALGYAIQNVSIKEFDDTKRRHNLGDHLFYTFATLCSQGYIPDTLDQRSKILGLSKKIFAWLLLIVLGAHLISYMTNEKVQPPFEDIESMLSNTNYTLLSYNGSIAFDQYVILTFDLIRKGYNFTRFQYASSQDEMYERGCSDKSEFAVFDLEDMEETVGNSFCELVPIGKAYIPTWVTFGVTKDFEYKRTFDIGIIKMREFGLIDRIANRWLRSPVETDDSEADGRSAFVPVDFHKVLVFFVILAIGMVASATIFVLEVIYFVYKSNQPRTVRGKVLIAKARLIANHPPAENYNCRSAANIIRCCNKKARRREACLCCLSSVFSCPRQ